MRDPESERAVREAHWADWMRRAQEGDSDAYERLLQDVLPDLRALVGARLRDPSGAEDVVQNVLFSIHRARHTFEPGRPFGPWMRAIARNAVIDAHRARSSRLRREVPLESDADVPDTSEHVDPHQPLPAWLQQALDALPAAQREAVELIHLRELSVAQAAEIVGIRPGALKVRAHRGYKALRAMLANRGPR